ncbi:nuclear transport factor 2 family protein [Nocardia sp. NPDC004123]
MLVLTTFEKGDMIIPTTYSHLAIPTALRRASRRRYDAMIAADIDALSTILAPELIYTHTNGDMDSKESYLEKVRSRYFDYHSIAHADDKIVRLGGAFLLYGRMRANASLDGKDIMINNVILTAWAHTDIGWQMFAHQPTPLQPVRGLMLRPFGRECEAM